MNSLKEGKKKLRSGIQCTPRSLSPLRGLILASTLPELKE